MKALQNLTHIHPIFSWITEVACLKFRHYKAVIPVVRLVYKIPWNTFNGSKIENRGKKLLRLKSNDATVIPFHDRTFTFFMWPINENSVTETTLEELHAKMLLIKSFEKIVRGDSGVRIKWILIFVLCQEFYLGTNIWDDHRSLRGTVT